MSARGCVIGLAEWRLPRSGADAVRYGARVGAEGLQLDFGGPGRGEWADAPGRARALREASAATGVALLALAGNVLNDVGLAPAPGGPAEARVRRLLARLLDTARELAVPLAFVPSFRRGAIKGPAAFARTARTLAWAAAEAEARGLLLASENVLRVAGARALVEAVGSPAFRLVLDTFNPVHAGLDCARLVAGTAPWLADQVHLKDGPPPVGETPPLGRGSGRLEATLAALGRRRARVAALVLENDYRGGGADRIAADLAWARAAVLRHGLGPGKDARAR
ncbi:TIM barrel protein [Sphaerisporangium sp. TRM90804]|uniref:sugar phosphate isomerase/epimerase family protein n=1 Tax=Sphaerisporangium sp. TRM90804 TaxID=3031113 RepID=UPI00244B82FF|nr:TIM barrel protein [Sphaerisporangium sp. TRM90804]MDH2427320.1 TIM barrel protein [Sphaerisporangium sp. TRM90804]